MLTQKSPPQGGGFCHHETVDERSNVGLADGFDTGTKRIGAIVTIHGVIAGAAIHRVITRTANHVVVRAATTVARIPAAGRLAIVARQRFAGKLEILNIGTTDLVFDHDTGLAILAFDEHISAAEADIIVLSVSIQNQRIGALLLCDRVLAAMLDDVGVVIPAASKIVIATSTFEDVVALTTEQRVICSAACQRITALAANLVVGVRDAETDGTA